MSTNDDTSSWLSHIVVAGSLGLALPLNWTRLRDISFFEIFITLLITTGEGCIIAFLIYGVACSVHDRSLVPLGEWAGIAAITYLGMAVIVGTLDFLNENSPRNKRKAT